jgi:hypothetical protein
MHVQPEIEMEIWTPAYIFVRLGNEVCSLKSELRTRQGPCMPAHAEVDEILETIVSIG